jgi:hypothetical protein
MLPLLFRYICHLIEQCCQCEESTLDGRIESGLNMRDAVSTSILSKLQCVEDELAELSVRQAEEQDAGSMRGNF